ncbi:hypothetical protein Sros01_78920 [Streptomyces roseochromogenus]|nr:hypothetical protein Sros01_78920 [Streptomyces roseochromogenus]
MSGILTAPGSSSERAADTTGRRDAPRWEELAHRAVASTADGYHYRITVDGLAVGTDPRRAGQGWLTASRPFAAWCRHCCWRRTVSPQ